jgi:hypothetical protein
MACRILRKYLELKSDDHAVDIHGLKERRIAWGVLNYAVGRRPYREIMLGTMPGRNPP